MGKSKGGAAAAKNKKNKGPKGKKARAKAKLERQWGEVPVLEASRSNRNDDTPKDGGKLSLSRSRKHSRLLGTTKKDKNALSSAAQSNDLDDVLPTTTTSRRLRDAATKSHEMDLNQSSDDDNSFSSASADEDNHEEEGALSILLETIHKPKRTGDDDDESERESESDSVTRKARQTTNDAVMQEDSDDELAKEDDSERLSLEMDPWTLRFSQSSTMSLSSLQASHDTSALKFRDDSLQLAIHASKSLFMKLRVNPSDVALSHAKHLHNYFLQSCTLESLFTCWKGLQKTTKTRRNHELSSSTLWFHSFLASYADVLFTSDNRENRNECQQLLALHILNHLLKSRAVVQKNNKAKRKREERQAANNRAELEEEEDNQDDDADVLRDQGYTRPTVVVLLPTRGCAHRFVDILSHLLLGEDGATSAENYDRFQEEYGPLLTSIQQEGDDEATLRRRRKIQSQKGAEWNELFGDCINDDDDFRMGIALHHSSKGMKLFCDFYKSDLIVASPLGLKMAATDGDAADSRGADFLSSIEVCVLLRAEVLLMQNWDHVNDVLALMNQQPKSSAGTDFSRVRNYLLAGHAAHWRQLIISSSFLDPLLVSTFKRNAQSIDGLARIRSRTDESNASITKVLFPTRQVFQRVPTSSLATYSQERVQYFDGQVFPQLLRHKQKHTMIFIPSYFDFCAVRNLFLRREFKDFVSITEYSRHSEISRGRARFLQGLKSILLYTGRAHFFHRHFIKGVRNVVFLGLPEYAGFYPQLVNQLAEAAANDGQHDQKDGNSFSCLSLFTKYEAQALERIVGSANCNRMMTNAEKSTFLFGS